MGTPAPKPTTLPRWSQLDAWQASTVYTVGERVINDSPGKIYVCTVAGESDSSGGPTGTGGAITDNEVTWAYVSDAADAWVGATPYAEGDRVINGGNLYACIVAGTSAGSGGPTTTNTNGINQIVDGTVRWVFLSAATALITEPNATKKDVGHLVGERPPAQYENWFKYSVYRWLRFVKDWTRTIFFPDVPAGDREVIMKWAVATIGGHTVYARLFASKHNEGEELTINADWDGAKWVSDDSGTKATRYVQTHTTTGWQSHAAAANWLEAAWQLNLYIDPGAGISSLVLGIIAVTLGATGNITTSAGNLVASGTPSGSAGPGLAKVKRIYGNGSAADLDSGDISGWGNTATVAAAGTDLGFNFTVTSGGTGQTSTPSVGYDFADGTWTTAPTVLVALKKCSDASDQGTPIKWDVTATTITITFLGTPTAGRTYEFAVVVMG